MYVSCNHHTVFKLYWTRKNTFAVCTSDTPVTLKQRQGHQTQYESVDLMQGDNLANVERAHLTSVRDKADAKVFVKSGNL